MLTEARKILLKQYGMESSEEDWAIESVIMEREELDPGLLPKEIVLADLVMTHVYLFDDNLSKDDYTVYFITDETSNREYLRGVLVDGKLIWHQMGSQNE